MPELTTVSTVLVIHVHLLAFWLLVILLSVSFLDHSRVDLFIPSILLLLIRKVNLVGLVASINLESSL